MHKRRHSILNCTQEEISSNSCSNGVTTSHNHIISHMYGKSKIMQEMNSKQDKNKMHSSLMNQGSLNLVPPRVGISHDHEYIGTNYEAKRVVTLQDPNRPPKSYETK